MGLSDAPGVRDETLTTLTQPATAHICIAANTTWYVWNFRSRLIAELIEQGYFVTVISPPDEFVQRLASLGARHVPLHIDNASTNPFLELVTLVRLVGLLRRVRPTILLTYTPKMNIYTALVARYLRIPVIPNVSGLGRAFITGGWLEGVVRRLYRIAFQSTRLVFFQNEDDRAEFTRAGIVQLSKTERLPGSGVDIDRFSPGSRHAGKPEFVFLLVARLLWDKGVAEYVDAAQRIHAGYPAAKFRIAGFLDVKNPSAISRKQMDEWTEKGPVEYVGAVDDMRGIYAEADCVVLPSYREGVPRTLLEAASMALPIITTNVVGCRDAVEDGVTGLLCRQRDSMDLAEKMRCMLSLTDGERIIMGQAGRKKMIREFDERFVIARYLEAVNDIVRSTM